MALTPEQEAIVAARGSELLVVAGAGTGKTHALVERYLALLGECEAAELVAVTFTDAAATEMRERVRREVTHRPELARHRDSLDEAPIGTIHSFCYRILLEQAATAGIDPETRVLAEDEAEYEVLAACSDALEAASEDGSGALAILELSKDAGPDGVVPLLAEMVRARDDVAAAFAAMGEGEAAVASYIDRLLEDEVDRVPEADRDRLAHARSLLESAHCRNPADRLYEPWAAAVELADLLAGERIDRKRATALAAAVRVVGNVGAGANWHPDPAEIRRAIFAVRKVAAAVLEAGPNEFEPRAVAATVALRAVFEDACRRYRERKESLLAFDYLDLEERARDLLRSRPDIAAEYHTRFRHLLVDEFQDTNPIQAEIIGLLAGGGAVQRFYVGDAKQAIFRFRGGDVRAFNQTRGRLPADAVLPLSRSFRSHAGLAAVLNPLFEKVFEGAHRDFEAAMDRLEGREGELPSGACVTVIRAGAAPSGTGTDDRTRFEAMLIAREIQSLLAGPRPIWDRRAGWRPVEKRDIAIVLRRFTKAQIFESALAAAGIAFEVQRGTGFFQRPEIKDLTNLLAWLAEPDDEVALVGALRSPLFTIDDETLLRLRAGRRRPFILGLREPPPDLDDETSARLRSVASVLGELSHAAAGDSVDVVLARALALTGYEAALAPLPGGERAVRNVRKLLRLAQSLRSRSIDEFVDYLVRRRDELETREAQAVLDDADAVRILTVHGAKGLEFPVVFVAETDERARSTTDVVRWHRDRGVSVTLAKDDEDASGSRPRPGFYAFLQARDRAEDEAEHRRLFYVACTRAGDYLYLCGDDPPQKGSWLDTALPVLAGLPAALVDIRPPEPVDLSLLRRAAPAPLVPPDAASEEVFVAPLAARPPVIPVRTSTPVTALLPGRPPFLYGHGDGLAAFRGTLAHRAIEAACAPGGGPSIRELARLVDGAPLDERLVGQVVADVGDYVARFQASDLGRWLGNPAAEPRFELPFAWDWDGVPVHGVIDLVYQDAAGRLQVVDFKTDRLDGRTPAQVAEPYLAQLGLYGLALERATGHRPGLAICLLRSGELHACAWPQVETALAAARARVDRGEEIAAEVVE